MHVGLDRFAEARACLVALHGQGKVDEEWPRLREIYEFAEARWRDHVARIGSAPVRYVAIGEAAPWIEHGAPQHVLDPHSRPTPYIRALRSALDCPPGYGSADAIAFLAHRGLLWVDALPFATRYHSMERAGRPYGELVRVCIKTYLLPKIARAGLKASADTRLAFMLKLNARAILRSFKTLPVGGQELPISTELIAATSSGYPGGDSVKRIFRLAR